MNVLVTGGSGFVCLNIVEKLLAEGQNVTVFDMSRVPEAAEQEFSSLPGTLTQVQGDILDADLLTEVLDKYKITDVIHGAAITPTLEQELNDPMRVLNINFMGTMNVLERLRSHPGVSLMYISSTGACGHALANQDEIDEEDLIFTPDGSYGVAKYASERMIIKYAEWYGIKAVTIRLGAVFGPWEHPNKTRVWMSPALRIMQAFAANEEVTFNRFSNEDWIYSREIAEDVWELLHCDAYLYDSYCLVSGTYWSSEKWCSLITENGTKGSYRTTKEGEEAILRIVRPRDFAHIINARLFKQIPHTVVYDQEKAFNDYSKWLEAHPDFR